MWTMAAHVDDAVHVDDGGACGRWRRMWTMAAHVDDAMHVDGGGGRVDDAMHVDDVVCVCVCVWTMAVYV